LTVAKARRVQRDGIRFQGVRYLDPTLAAYIGESVMIRYDPRDMAEIRVFHNNQFLCRAVSPELAGETLSLRDLIRARNRRRRDLRHTLQERQRTVDALLDTRRWTPREEEAGTPLSTPEPLPTRLKRYINE